MRILIALSILMLTGHTAHAGTWCNGDVRRILVESDGDTLVYTDWSPTWFMICRINSEWKGVPGETCRSWIALLESAKAQGLQVGFKHDEDGMSCGAIPAYAGAPAPVAVSPFRLGRTVLGTRRYSSDTQGV